MTPRDRIAGGGSRVSFCMPELRKNFPSLCFVRGVPALESVQATVNGVEIGALHLFGDRSPAPGADAVVVDLPDGRDLGGGAGEEHLLGAEHRRAREALGFDGQLEVSRDLDDAVLRLHGLKKDDSKERASRLSPKECRQCSTQNAASNRFCSLCGLALDSKTEVKIVQDELRPTQADAILDQMLEDPLFKAQFVRRLNGVLKKDSLKKPMVTSRSE